MIKPLLLIIVSSVYRKTRDKQQFEYKILDEAHKSSYNTAEGGRVKPSSKYLHTFT